MVKKYVYQSVLTAQVTAMISATTITWSSPSLDNLNTLDDNPLGRVITSAENSWLAAIAMLGGCCGSIIYGLLSMKFGRKTLLLSIVLMFFLMYLTMTLSNIIELFYIARFFSGLGMGGTFTVIPIYSGEIADSKSRCVFGATLSMFVNIGMLIPYCIGPYISFFWFHAILTVVPAVFMVPLVFNVPESPYFLVRRNHSKAESILNNLKKKEDAARTLKWIMEDIDNGTKTSFADIIKARGLQKAYLIGIILIMFCHLTGNDILIAYAQQIFDAASDNLPKGIGPMCIGVSQLITSFSMSMFADKFPRKLLLTISHLGIASAQVILGLYLLLQNTGQYFNTWLPPLCLTLMAIMYNVGIGPVFLTLLGELFPTNVKGLAVSCIVIYNWMAAFIMTLLFNTLKTHLGMGPLYLIYAVCGTSAAIYIKFFLIETKGKTLEEVQISLNEGNEQTIMSPA